MSGRTPFVRKTLSYGFGAVCAMAVCLVAVEAFAQPPRGGRGGPGGRGGFGPPPEMRDQIWEMQAKAVAGDMRLSAEQTSKLVNAYTAARERHHDARREAFRTMDRGDRRGNFEAMQRLDEAQRAKLEKDLTAKFDEKTAAKAVSVLGLFNPQYDRLTHHIAEMSLTPDDEKRAMSIINKHVVALDKKLQSAREGGDFRGMREAMREQDENLNNDLAAVFTDAQQEKWQELNARRGPGGPRGEGRGPEFRGPRGEGPPPGAPGGRDPRGEGPPPRD